MYNRVIIGVLALLLLAGCLEEPTGTGMGCALDSECEGDDVCIDQQCMQACASDRDCSLAPCLLDDASGYSRCHVPYEYSETTDNSAPAIEGFTHWMIKDISANAECNNTSPGVDIYGVRLVNAGEVVGTTKLIASGIVNSGNDFSAPAGLTQSADLTADQCLQDAPVTSLGCGGWVVVAFEDADGTLIDLVPDNDPTMQLEVFGGTCDGSTYVVACCPQLPAGQYDASSCNTCYSTEPSTGYVGRNVAPFSAN